MMQYEIERVVQKVAAELQERGWRVATAESCTAGWIAKVLTDPAGSTAWFERGFVSYSNESKIEMLDVSEQTIQQHGAVSEETVREMVTGALARSHAEVAVAVSGIAGPSGGSDEKPVGLVWFGWQVSGQEPYYEHHILDGDRATVRGKTVLIALEGVFRALKRASN